MVANDGPGVEQRAVDGTEKAAARRVAGPYCYRGAPALPGEMTRTLIVAATSARNEKKKIGLLYQGELLSAFSGIEPPVQPAEMVDNAALRAVFAYVQSVAAFPWKRGRKYFYQHPIDGPR